MSVTFNASTASIRQAMESIQSASTNLAVAVDTNGALVGVVTDGDIRRALLSGAKLEDPVGPYLRLNPVTVFADESRASVIDLMQARGIGAVPIVGVDGRFSGVHLLRELLGRVSRPNVAVVMAGGRGSRLLPPDAASPKPMMRVAGRPILERIVNHLVGFGIQSVVISIGFRGEVIERYFGDGTMFGCKITFIREDPSQGRGTAGSLHEIPQLFPDLCDPLLVLNGDLVTSANIGDLLAVHRDSQASVTVAAHRYTHEIPFGVLVVGEAGRVHSVVEKPVREELVSAGIYAMEPRILDLVPADGPFHMTDLIETCLKTGHTVSSWQCEDDWIDVGRPSDLATARGLNS